MAIFDESIFTSYKVFVIELILISRSRLAMTSNRHFFGRDKNQISICGLIILLACIFAYHPVTMIKL